MSPWLTLRTALSACAAIAAMAGASGAARATTVLQVTVAQMTETSQWVVRAHVLGSRVVDLREYGQGLFTDVDLLITDVYSGSNVPEVYTLRLVGGHPYLVHRGLQEMVSHGIDIATFEAQADRDEGIFGDHLRRILVLLVQDPELMDVVRGVLRRRPCPTSHAFYRLRASGLMAGESAQDCRPRCQLYANYLERHLR